MPSRSPSAYTLLRNYPWHCVLATRFSDQDPNFHINNVAMIGLFQEARLRFTAALDVDGAIRRATTVAASLKTEFIQEALYPTDLTMGVGFVRMGRTSWTVIQGAFCDDQCLAVCEVTVVRLVDGAPDEAPAGWRSQHAAFSIRGIDAQP